MAKMNNTKKLQVGHEYVVAFEKNNVLALVCLQEYPHLYLCRTTEFKHNYNICVNKADLACMGTPYGIHSIKEW